MIRNMVVCLGSVVAGIFYGEFIFNETMTWYVAMFSFFGVVAIYLVLIYLIEINLVIKSMEREEE